MTFEIWPSCLTFQLLTSSDFRETFRESAGLKSPPNIIKKCFAPATLLLHSSMAEMSAPPQRCCSHRVPLNAASMRVLALRARFVATVLLLEVSILRTSSWSDEGMAAPACPELELEEAGEAAVMAAAKAAAAAAVEVEPGGILASASDIIFQQLKRDDDRRGITRS